MSGLGECCKEAYSQQPTVSISLALRVCLVLGWVGSILVFCGKMVLSLCVWFEGQTKKICHRLWPVRHSSSHSHLLSSIIQLIHPSGPSHGHPFCHCPSPNPHRPSHGHPLLWSPLSPDDIGLARPLGPWLSVHTRDRGRPHMPRPLARLPDAVFFRGWAERGHGHWGRLLLRASGFSFVRGSGEAWQASRLLLRLRPPRRHVQSPGVSRMREERTKRKKRTKEIDTKAFFNLMYSLIFYISIKKIW